MMAHGAGHHRYGVLAPYRLSAVRRAAHAMATASLPTWGAPKSASACGTSSSR
jgi:hypothetical protein